MPIQPVYLGRKKITDMIDFDNSIFYHGTVLLTQRAENDSFLVMQIIFIPSGTVTQGRYRVGINRKVSGLNPTRRSAGRMDLILRGSR